MAYCYLPLCPSCGSNPCTFGKTLCAFCYRAYKQQQRNRTTHNYQQPIPQQTQIPQQQTQQHPMPLFAQQLGLRYEQRPNPQAFCGRCGSHKNGRAFCGNCGGR